MKISVTFKHFSPFPNEMKISDEPLASFFQMAPDPTGGDGAWRQTRPPTHSGLTRPPARPLASTSMREEDGPSGHAHFTHAARPAPARPAPARPDPARPAPARPAPARPAPARPAPAPARPTPQKRPRYVSNQRPVKF